MMILATHEVCDMHILYLDHPEICVDSKASYCEISRFLMTPLTHFLLPAGIAMSSVISPFVAFHIDDMAEKKR